jgi:FtsP/CotA-like multicopper oxidase with cupredoxin domain
MNDNNTKTTNVFTSIINLVKEHPNSKQFYIICAIFLASLIGAISLLSSKGTNEGMAMDMKMMKHTANFGPGDAFHVHKKIDPAKFEYISDISKNPDDLPAALNRKTAKTIEINLNATEVISDIAAATPFHYWTFDNTVPGPFLRVRVGDTVKLTLHNDKKVRTTIQLICMRLLDPVEVLL